MFRFNRTPSYHQGFARSASESKYPYLWKALVGAWVPSLGVTGFTLFDQSPFKNHGTLTNMESDDWIVDEAGRVLDLDGTNEFIDCGNSPKLTWLAGEKISIFSRARKAASGGFNSLVAKSSGTDRHLQFGYNDSASPLLTFHYRDTPSDNFHTFTKTGGVTLGPYYNFSFSYEWGIGSTAQIYQNGLAVAGSWTGGDGNGNPRSSSLAFTVGGRVAGDGSLNGQIAVTYVWKRILTANEHALLDLDPLAPFQLADLSMGISLPMAIEDFTTYTEVDAGSDITITSSRVTFTVLPRNVESYVYYDKAAGFFDGSVGWIHNFEMFVSASDTGSVAVGWMVSNTIDDLAGQRGVVSRLNFYWGGDEKMVLEEGNGTANQFDVQASTLSLSTLYYMQVEVDPAVGSFGTVYGRVFSDSDRTSLVEEMFLAIAGSVKDYRYIYGLNTFNSGTAQDITGYVQNLDLAPSPPVTIDSHAYLAKIRQQKNNLRRM